MTVTLHDALRAAAARRACITADTAGYVILQVADALAGTPRAARSDDVVLTEDGSVQVVAIGPGVPDGSAAALRQLLGEMLVVARGAAPALRQVSERSPSSDLWALVVEIEAALIPVNRSAARRAIARLWRETSRAKERGQLAELEPVPAEAHAEPESVEGWSGPVPAQAAVRMAAEPPVEPPVEGAARPSEPEPLPPPGPAEPPVEGAARPSEPEPLPPPGPAEPPLPVPPAVARIDRTLPLPDFAPPERASSLAVAVELAPEPGPFPRLEPADATPLLGSILHVVSTQAPSSLDRPSHGAAPSQTPPMPSGVAERLDVTRASGGSSSGAADESTRSALEPAANAGDEVLFPVEIITLAVETASSSDGVQVSETATGGGTEGAEVDDGWETVGDLFVTWADGSARGGELSDDAALLETAGTDEEPAGSVATYEAAGAVGGTLSRGEPPADPVDAWEDADDVVVTLTEAELGDEAVLTPPDRAEPYVPRRSNLEDLLHGFVVGQARSDRDLSRTLKRLAGVDVTPTPAARVGTRES